MQELLINPQKLRDTAHSFNEASNTLMALLKDLNDSVKELEKDWEGASQQVFYKQYEDLQKYLDAFAGISTNIAREMNSMADHFEKIDLEDFKMDAGK